MQVHLNIKEVIMLEVAESIEMKADEYCHDFRPAHSTFPIAVLTPVRLTNGHQVDNLTRKVVLLTCYFT